MRECSLFLNCSPFLLLLRFFSLIPRSFLHHSVFFFSFLLLSLLLLSLFYHHSSLSSSSLIIFFSFCKLYSRNFLPYHSFPSLPLFSSLLRWKLTDKLSLFLSLTLYLYYLFIYLISFLKMAID